MKISAIIVLLVGLVSALAVEKRQFGLSSTSNELTSGACKPVIFIFARGSTETGNMGSTVGPATCRYLKSAIGSDKVACQGVGGGYRADIGSNALPKGSSSAGFAEGKKMFELAASRCPTSQVVAGGYSQGAALIAGTITDLDDDVKNQIKGVVLYGYTKNRQNSGKIPDYPAERTKVYCNASDGVCNGALAVTVGHLTYSSNTRAAAQFLQGTLDD